MIRQHISHTLHNKQDPSYSTVMMKSIHTNPEIIQRCKEAHGIHKENPVARPKQQVRTDEGASSSPTFARSSEQSSNVDSQNTELSRQIESTILKRLNRFDSTSCLPRSTSRRVSRLSWADLSVGALLGCGGFSSVHSVSIRPKQNELW